MIFLFIFTVKRRSVCEMQRSFADHSPVVKLSSSTEVRGQHAVMCRS